MEQKIKIVQYGIGPIGLMITKFLVERSDFQIVGAIDNDKSKLGKDLGELAGISRLNVLVQNDSAILSTLKPDVILLTTTSSLERIKPQVLEILSFGINIVSTCEELTYPWITKPGISNEIDKVAKQSNVSVLSTGVNPGFLMDFLPSSITAVCKKVDKIFVERIQDAQFRRIPFQNKIGAGLTIEEFKKKVDEGNLRHVGLTESMHMIAHKTGWQLSRTSDIIEPVIAEQSFNNKEIHIEKGKMLGVKQTGRSFVNNKEVITLNFIAAVGQPDPHDRIYIEGSPNLDMTIKNGVNGDIATCAIAVNAIKPVLNATSGLRTMADMEPISCL